ncbi:MAG: hypothetical protein MZV49_00090 [Rhodopseudomonas palustris]|nr:hypothetical protein [Rhodopseudomonas palustris]
MDFVKLGRNVRADDVFSRKFFKFETVYDREARELEVRIPAKSMMFRENAEGKLQIDLVFVFYIYPDEGKAKESFRESRSVALHGRRARGPQDGRLPLPPRAPAGHELRRRDRPGPEGTKGMIRRSSPSRSASETTAPRRLRTSPLH